jgi:hypothetical protein
MRSVATETADMSLPCHRRYEFFSKVLTSFL